MQETGNNNTSNTLSICFRADGFSFFGPYGSKSIQFACPDATFMRGMATCLCESDIWQDYGNVNVEIDDEYTSLFPTDMLDRTNREQILEKQFLPNLNTLKYDILEDNIEGFDITNTFAINKELHAFILDNIPYASITHTVSPVIASALKSSRKSGDVEVWCKATESVLYIVVANCGELTLSSRHTIKAMEDVLYFIGATFSQNKLSQQNTPLYISADSKVFDALKERVALCKQVTL